MEKEKKNGKLVMVFDGREDVQVITREVYDPDSGIIRMFVDNNIAQCEQLVVESGDTISFKHRGDIFKAQNYFGRKGHEPGGVIRRLGCEDQRKGKDIIGEVSSDDNVTVVYDVASVFWVDDE